MVRGRRGDGEVVVVESWRQPRSASAIYRIECGRCASRADNSRSGARSAGDARRSHQRLPEKVEGRMRGLGGSRRATSVFGMAWQRGALGRSQKCVITGRGRGIGFVHLCDVFGTAWQTGQNASTGACDGARVCGSRRRCRTGRLQQSRVQSARQGGPWKTAEQSGTSRGKKQPRPLHCSSAQDQQKHRTTLIHGGERGR